MLHSCRRQDPPSQRQEGWLTSFTGRARAPGYGRRQHRPQESGRHHAHPSRREAIPGIARQPTKGWPAISLPPRRPVWKERLLVPVLRPAPSASPLRILDLVLSHPGKKGCIVARNLRVAVPPDLRPVCALPVANPYQRNCERPSKCSEQGGNRIFGAGTHQESCLWWACGPKAGWRARRAG